MNETAQTTERIERARDIAWLEEQVLVLRAQWGDHDAFHRLVILYDRRLLYYLRRLLGETERASDVAQEVWLTVYRRITALRSPAAFRVWLFRIAHDRAVSTIQRDQRRIEAHEELALGSEAGEEWGELTLLENSRLVHLALAQISLAHSEVLTLRFLEDLSLNEIAEVVGCGIATVKTRIHYAKRSIRKKIEELVRQP